MELKAKVLQRDMDKQIMILYDSLNKARHDRLRVDHEKFRADKSSLDEEVAYLKNDMMKLVEEKVDIITKKERLESELWQCTSDRKSLESEHQQCNKRIIDLRSEIVGLHAKLEDQRKNTERLKMYYVRYIHSQEDGAAAQVEKLTKEKEHVQEMLDKCVTERNRLRLELDLRREAMDMLIE